MLPFTTDLSIYDANVQAMLNEMLDFGQRYPMFKNSNTAMSDEMVDQCANVFKALLQTPITDHPVIIQLATCSFISDFMEGTIMIRELFAEDFLDTGFPVNKRERLYLEMLFAAFHQPSVLADCISELTDPHIINEVVHDEYKFFMDYEFFKGLKLDKALFIPEFLEKYKDYPYVVKTVQNALTLDTFSYPDEIRNLASDLDEFTDLGKTLTEFGTAIDNAVFKGSRNCSIDFSVDYRTEVVCINGDMWIRTEEEPDPVRIEVPVLAYTLLRMLQTLGEPSPEFNFNDCIAIFK